ncbi:MAG: hypothetical protein Q9M24_04995 [Mariprofundaceae bacterium]|nr:hypothetical protein [Mariprofundaceae bacterium]
MLTCRLYIQPPLTTEREITLGDGQGHYLRHVMRLRNGDPVILFDGKGGEHEAIIHRLEKSGTV